MVNVSAVGYRAALCQDEAQMDGSTIENPISFISKTLTAAERTDGVSERELAVLHWALTNFSWCLLGAPTFRCWSDCRHLGGLYKWGPKGGRRDAMMADMRKYDFTIGYRKVESARRETHETSFQALMESAHEAGALRVAMQRVRAMGFYLTTETKEDYEDRVAGLIRKTEALLEKKMNAYKHRVLTEMSILADIRAVARKSVDPAVTKRATAPLCFNIATQLEAGKFQRPWIPSRCVLDPGADASSTNQAWASQAGLRDNAWFAV